MILDSDKPSLATTVRADSLKPLGLEIDSVRYTFINPDLNMCLVKRVTTRRKAGKRERVSVRQSEQPIKFLIEFIRQAENYLESDEELEFILLDAGHGNFLNSNEDNQRQIWIEPVE